MQLMMIVCLETLKNQGYRFEHNFRHGHEHLATVFAYLMMLAFPRWDSGAGLIDQIQQRGCTRFAKARAKAERPRSFWDKSLPPSPIGGAHVDTGAMLSCIDSVLAATLHLLVVDRESVSGVHGSQEVNVHLTQIHIPSLDSVVIGRFHGVHLAQGNQPHLALLGRVFLRNFTMTYDGRAGSVKIRRNEGAAP